MKYSAIALLLSAALTQQAQAADNSNLSGVLQDNEGKPLANVEIFISSENQSVTTDENGRFEFKGLELDVMFWISKVETRAISIRRFNILATT